MEGQISIYSPSPMNKDGLIRELDDLSSLFASPVRPSVTKQKVMNASPRGNKLNVPSGNTHKISTSSLSKISANLLVEPPANGYSSSKSLIHDNLEDSVRETDEHNMIIIARAAVPLTTKKSVPVISKSIKTIESTPSTVNVIAASAVTPAVVQAVVQAVAPAVVQAVTPIKAKVSKSPSSSNVMTSSTGTPVSMQAVSSTKAKAATPSPVDAATASMLRSTAAPTLAQTKVKSATFSLIDTAITSVSMNSEVSPVSHTELIHRSNQSDESDSDYCITQSVIILQRFVRGYITRVYVYKMLLAVMVIKRGCKYKIARSILGGRLRRQNRPLEIVMTGIGNIPPKILLSGEPITYRVSVWWSPILHIIDPSVDFTSRYKPQLIIKSKLLSYELSEPPVDPHARQRRGSIIDSLTSGLSAVRRMTPLHTDRPSILKRTMSSLGYPMDDEKLETARKRNYCSFNDEKHILSLCHGNAIIKFDYLCGDKKFGSHLFALNQNLKPKHFLFWGGDYKYDLAITDGRDSAALNTVSPNAATARNSQSDTSSSVKAAAVVTSLPLQLSFKHTVGKPVIDRRGTNVSKSSFARYLLESVGVLSPKVTPLTSPVVDGTCQTPNSSMSILSMLGIKSSPAQNKASENAFKKMSQNNRVKHNKRVVTNNPKVFCVYTVKAGPALRSNCAICKVKIIGNGPLYMAMRRKNFMSSMLRSWTKKTVVLNQDGLHLFDTRYQTTPIFSISTNRLHSLNAYYGSPTKEKKRFNIIHRKVTKHHEDNIDIVITTSTGEELVMRYGDAKTRNKWIHTIHNVIEYDRKKNSKKSSMYSVFDSYRFIKNLSANVSSAIPQVTTIKKTEKISFQGASIKSARHVTNDTNGRVDVLVTSSPSSPPPPSTTNQHGISSGTPFSSSSSSNVIGLIKVFRRNTRFNSSQLPYEHQLLSSQPLPLEEFSFSNSDNDDDKSDSDSDDNDDGNNNCDNNGDNNDKRSNAESIGQERNHDSEFVKENSIRHAD